MSSEIEVRPIRSFEFGGAIRTPKKGAFMVEARAGEQLRAMGLVSADNEQVALATNQSESKPESAVSRRRRQPAQAAGQDE